MTTYQEGYWDGSVDERERIIEALEQMGFEGARAALDPLRPPMRPITPTQADA